MGKMTLHDEGGNRLYLSQDERTAFLETAKLQLPEVRTLAETLVYTGCRISEALELVPKRVQLKVGRIVFRSLKKRGRVHYREIPVPSDYLDTLNVVHNIRKHQQSQGKESISLWPWQRMQAYKHIKRVMKEAGIPDGKRQSPKGLRHAFGVTAIGKGVPLNILQKWLGHSSMETTAIYADAVGKEENEIALKMWN